MVRRTNILYKRHEHQSLRNPAKQDRMKGVRSLMPGADAIGRLASLSSVQLAHTQHLACLHQVEGCLPLYLGDEAGNRALWEGFEHL